jgi:hypothetical protein
MLRQEELAFVKAISNLQVSPDLLKELRLAMSRRKRKPAVPAGSHSIGSGAKAPYDCPVSSWASAKPLS